MAIDHRMSELSLLVGQGGVANCQYLIASQSATDKLTCLVPSLMTKRCESSNDSILRLSSSRFFLHIISILISALSIIIVPPSHSTASRVAFPKAPLLFLIAKRVTPASIALRHKSLKPSIFTVIYAMTRKMLIL